MGAPAPVGPTGRSAFMARAAEIARRKREAAAPPSPPDETRVMLAELARQRTERELRRSRGRAGAFLSMEPYRAPGSRSTLG